jgi:hypothetical protein
MTIHRSGAGTAAPALAAAAAALLVYAFDPAVTALYPPCPFRALTGLLCPLCGSLRAAHQLLHGHVAEAFALNPLTVGGAAAVAAAATTGLRPALVTAGAWRVAIAAAIAFAIVRNL